MTINKQMDVKGPILANTLYCDGFLVGRDVEFTLPDITFKTAEIQAMGTMTVPLIGLIENMELTISRVGIDSGYGSLNKLNKHMLEFRWAQVNISKSGTTTTEGCKAYVRTMPSSIPGFSNKPGDAITASHKYNVTRMQVFLSGKEILLVDRLNNILRINGVNYSSSIENLL